VLGFNLFRADAPEAPLMRLNDEILPCLAPGSPAGDTYRFLDVTAAAGRVYYYWLQSVDLHGETMHFGPIAAAIPPGPFYQIYLPSVKH
jgi:hypothetical protein